MSICHGLDDEDFYASMEIRKIKSFYVELLKDPITYSLVLLTSQNDSKWFRWSSFSLHL